MKRQKFFCTNKHCLCVFHYQPVCPNLPAGKQKHESSVPIIPPPPPPASQSSQVDWENFEGPDGLYRPPQDFYHPEDLAFIKAYRHSEYWSINRGLRGQAPLYSESKRNISTLDRLIESSPPLPFPVTVLRALKTEQGTAVSIPSKGIYADPAFASTSTNRNYIEESVEVDENGLKPPTDTILSIELPAGFKVLAFSEDDPRYGFEEEVLLPRNTPIEILEDSGYQDGVRRIKGRVLAATD